MSETVKNPKRVEAGKKAWVTMRRRSATAKKAWVTRRKNADLNKLRESIRNGRK